MSKKIMVLFSFLLSLCFVVNADENEQWHKLCEDGDNKYCNLIGRNYISIKEYKKALNVYKKSCSVNDGEGCAWLGYLCFNGYGVRKNIRKANEFYLRSCDLGFGEGATVWRNFMKIATNWNSTVIKP
jgi:hypothetical protein